MVEAIEKVLKSYNKEAWDVVKAKYRDGTKSFKENFSNFFGDDANQAYEEYLRVYNPNSVKQCSPENKHPFFIALRQ
ncbi:MAG: hypothetical protein R3Y43_07565 [Alphaproteobacteria bacterium]